MRIVDCSVDLSAETMKLEPLKKPSLRSIATVAAAAINSELRPTQVYA